MNMGIEKTLKSGGLILLGALVAIPFYCNGKKVKDDYNTLNSNYNILKTRTLSPKTVADYLINPDTSKAVLGFYCPTDSAYFLNELKSVKDAVGYVSTNSPCNAYLKVPKQKTTHRSVSANNTNTKIPQINSNPKEDEDFNAAAQKVTGQILQGMLNNPNSNK